MEDVKLAGTITLFTFLFSLAVWTANRSEEADDGAITRCGVDRAVIAARQAELLVERLQRYLADMDKQVSDAVDRVTAASNDADRAAAKARLDELNGMKYELEKQVAEAKAAAARAERRRGVKVSDTCIDNPLVKGCM
jgi:hypothetical protein